VERTFLSVAFDFDVDVVVAFEVDADVGGWQTSTLRQKRLGTADPCTTGLPHFY
jgi:hypothetical protein